MGKRTIEAMRTSPEPFLLAVRLCDGEQVIAVRRLDTYRPSDQTVWQSASDAMNNHERFTRAAEGHLADGLQITAAAEAQAAARAFERAVSALWPELGSVPDGVKV